MSYYEELRGRAIAGDTRHGPGLAVLFSRGMAALLRLLEQMPTFDDRRKEISRQEKTRVIRLPETEHQLVQLLACMVLGMHQEVTHVH